MKYVIQHSIRGRMRIQTVRKKLTSLQADQMEIYLMDVPQIQSVRIRERIGSITILYTGAEGEVLTILDRFSFCTVKTEASREIPENSMRRINDQFRERILATVLQRAAIRIFLPVPVQNVITGIQSVRYILKALKGLAHKEMKLAFLDGAALVVAFIRSDYSSAGTHIFLLNICEILEQWVEKKKLENFSQIMSLNVDYVCLCSEGREVITTADQVHNGDLLLVREGEMIPFDGIVHEGGGNVVQASMSGNPLPVEKHPGDMVYAGTMLEEGELYILVEEKDRLSQYDKLIRMVDNEENLKPVTETRMMQRAEKMVPWLFGGGLLTYLLTRDMNRMASFFMVDISYALKLSLPLAVLSAKRDADQRGITIKGGRFMEQMALADTIIFDKTGTLTQAQSKLKEIVNLGEYDEDEILRMAACVEEHYPHIMAQAIVRAAAERHLKHDDMHTKLEKIISHGIATEINGQRAVIGCFHFVFEDEQCPVPEQVRQMMLQERYHSERHLFFAIDHRPVAVFCIGDELKPEAADTVAALRRQGFANVIMLTGDTIYSTTEVAQTLGITEYCTDMTTEDKAEYIRHLKEQGKCVVMVGDGVNDALALSTADVGIAINNGSKITIQVADVILDARNIFKIVELRELSCRVLERMNRDMSRITGTNFALTAAGVAGLLQPSTASAIGSFLTITGALQNTESYFD